MNEYDQYRRLKQEKIDFVETLEIIRTAPPELKKQYEKESAKNKKALNSLNPI